MWDSSDPEWQNILANTLVKLAKNGVYVIVTTHSSEMLKAFDICSKEQELGDALSAHYFTDDGFLLDSADSPLTPIQQAQQQLLAPYDDLTIRGYAL